ncbi:MAG TPA: KH domain-containing protein [Campylobacterales bacterium]|nr:KH domain-containing protein [Campylobacterales bacterium]
MVTEFVAEYAKLLVSHPEDIAVSVKNLEENYNEITILTNADDVGKLIGKEGRMINSIKTVISGCKAKGGTNYRVNVESK